jgi:lipid-A-disaccharide synthase
MPQDVRVAGPRPELAVGLEFARALGGLALLPGRLALDLVRRDRRRAELLAELGAEQAPRPEDPAAWPRGRPLRVMLSCAEASGELHGRSLLRSLQAHLAGRGEPPPEVVAIGGPRLAAAGARLIAAPVERAAMGFGVARSLPYWMGLLRDAARELRDFRPDVLVPVDSPALHLPLARIAARYGVPSVHFVAPQYWGWAPWRAAPYARAMDRALTILPFEPGWFARRGVAVEHVGHPLLDALAAVPVTRPEEEARTLVLLPGSRAGVIRRNLPWMLGLLEDLHQRLPHVEVQVLQEEAAAAELCRALVREANLDGRVAVVEGPLHGPLSRARAAFSVSGTVLLDLLTHRLPMVVVYRLGQRSDWARRGLLIAPWFASINLLAGRELVPEFAFADPGPRAAVGEALLRCYDDRAWRGACIRGLDEVARRLGPPGAARRAAAAVLELAAAQRAKERP